MHSSVYSPCRSRQITIHNLPVNVLDEIFASHCSEASLDLHSPITANALNLSHVCRSWMKITKSKPDLWSHLKIHLPNKKISHLELVELYLKRSTPALLTLAVDDKHDCAILSEFYIPSSSFRDHCWADERQNPDSIFWRIFRALLVRNPRWQDVSFYLLCDVLEQVFDKVGLKFADPDKALANMKSLKLSLYRSSASSDSFSGPFLRWLEEAPMLDTVELNYPYRSFSIPLFLQKHVSLSFRSLIADPAHIFHASSVLESLDLDVSVAYSCAESYPRVIAKKL
ncbi:hypothetical protein VKT23_001606 [Stygiomarasmius scandens]|uniref:F-box domain-containing protein n=1 Tax=Marasmiellus scandens TaxID=2682957 RepID=A0ABR1JZY1_9AGAR